MAVRLRGQARLVASISHPSAVRLCAHASASLPRWLSTSARAPDKHAPSIRCISSHLCHTAASGPDNAHIALLSLLLPDKSLINGAPLRFPRNGHCRLLPRPSTPPAAALESLLGVVTSVTKLSLSPLLSVQVHQVPHRPPGTSALHFSRTPCLVP